MKHAPIFRFHDACCNVCSLASVNWQGNWLWCRFHETLLEVDACIASCFNVCVEHTLERGVRNTCVVYGSVFVCCNSSVRARVSVHAQWDLTLRKPNWDAGISSKSVIIRGLSTRITRHFAAIVLILYVESVSSVLEVKRKNEICSFSRDSNLKVSEIYLN